MGHENYSLDDCHCNLSIMGMGHGNYSLDDCHCDLSFFFSFSFDDRPYLQQTHSRFLLCWVYVVLAGLTWTLSKCPTPLYENCLWSCRMSLITMVRTHPCPRDCNSNTSILNPLSNSWIPASKRLLVPLVRPRLEWVHSLATLIKPRIQYSQMLCPVPFDGASSLFTWLRVVIIKIMFCRLETQCQRIMKLVFIFRTGIPIPLVPMIPLWICMKKAPLMDLTDISMSWEIAGRHTLLGIGSGLQIYFHCFPCNSKLKVWYRLLLFMEISKRPTRLAISCEEPLHKLMYSLAASIMVTAKSFS